MDANTTSAIVIGMCLCILLCICICSCSSSIGKIKSLFENYDNVKKEDNKINTNCKECEECKMC